MRGDRSSQDLLPATFSRSVNIVIRFQDSREDPGRAASRRMRHLYLSTPDPGNYRQTQGEAG
jgi:hypothetical protein